MEKEAPIHLSQRHALLSRSAARASGSGRGRLEDGSKTRVCSKCETAIEKQK